MHEELERYFNLYNEMNAIADAQREELNKAKALFLRIYPVDKKGFQKNISFLKG